MNMLLRRSIRASRRERLRALTGDELMPEAAASITHAVTIEAPPADVWPWLAQMGASRGGWYSYDFIDNRGHRSANCIHREYLDINVGTVFPAVPGADDAFIVLQFEPEQSLVLGWLPEPEAPPAVTWAFVLDDRGIGHTRLIERARVRSPYEPFGLPEGLAVPLARAAHAVMARKQMLGLARRAERSTGAGRLELFIPHPEICERHSTLVAAPAAFVMHAARSFDMQSIGPVHALFSLRSRLMGAEEGAPDRGEGLAESTRKMGWGVLVDEPGRAYLSGAACQPWEANVVFSPLTAEDFASYSEPDYVKIAWSIEVESIDPSLCRLSTETRVTATDEQARRNFRRYWQIFGKGILAIRWLLLPAIRRRAEQAWTD